MDATEHRTLYVVNTDGSGGLTALSPADASVVDNNYFDGVSADSSPDGSQVVFAADVTSSQKALFVARVDGGGSHRIAIPSINPTTAQWSPDGGWIAFAGDEPSPLSLDLAQGLFALEDHFREPAPGRTTVRYEELVRRPREVLASLCASLGLEFDEAMLDWARADRRRVPAS